MGYNIKEIEGIGPERAEKLAEHGITTTDDLLEKCGGADGRKVCAEATGFDESTLLEWTNRADLMRINGVGEEYSDLLEAAGVDTVKELATRNAANLVEAMTKTNEEKNLTNALPSEEAVQGWIDEADKLDHMISH